jgi:hypothetical protein
MAAVIPMKNNLSDHLNWLQKNYKDALFAGFTSKYIEAEIPQTRPEMYD